MNHIELLEQTLEEIKSDSDEYKRLDELLKKLIDSGTFKEVLDQLVAK